MALSVFTPQNGQTQTISWTGVKILKRPSEKQDTFMIYYYYVLYD